MCYSRSYLNIKQVGLVCNFGWQCIQSDSLPGHSCIYSGILVLSLDLPEDIMGSTMHLNAVPSSDTISYVLLMDIFSFLKVTASILGLLPHF